MNRQKPLEEEVWVVIARRRDGCPKLCKALGPRAQVPHIALTDDLESQGSLIFFTKPDAEAVLAHLMPGIRGCFEVRRVLARIA